MDNNLLRPLTLSEFKGKETIKQNIKVYVKSAISQNKPFDHCLFYGLPGTGKTSLATIIANELKQKIKIVQGSNLQHSVDIVNIVMTLNEKDILFIDEIHAINPQVVELLYSIMEDFVIDIALGKDFNTKITRIKIPHFTLIGATTLLGKIPQPLEDRFGIIFDLKNYKLDDIIQILKASCNKLNIVLTDEEILTIAKNSKGIPRNANRLLSRVKDFRISNPKISINQVLKELQIIENGLDINDLLFLNCLFNQDRPIGLKTLSQMMSVDTNTIESKIEPYLLSNHYISKTSNGRVLTKNGINFINKHKSLLIN